MNQILGIGILIVFLFPLYFVYKEVKKYGVRQSGMVETYIDALLFKVLIPIFVGVIILGCIGFGVFLILGG